MPSVFDAQIEQLTQEAQAFVDASSELLLLPLACLGAAGGGAATGYRSDEFSVPPLPVDRTLVPGSLTIGLPRAGYLPEQIPVGALRAVPSVLTADQTGFHLVVDAERLAGAPGGTYWGEVTCVDSSQLSGNGVAVPVWLVIP